ncbi:hypothetical protein GCK32_003451 [Trichostrongylus colubriformis]|uniref:Uncharacterized protein n=1 Tax=Trichostrongylus colubriformis TaxID=6319 RepID=A0AAN8IZ15_TRICO
MNQASDFSTVMMKGMLAEAIFLLVVVTKAFSAVAIQEAKLGERVELDLGKGAVNWMRKTVNGEEFIRHCGPTEKGPRCAQFVKAVGGALHRIYLKSK